MAGTKRSKRKETVTAQVTLRSVSGRSIRELASGPLPEDLTPFRASEAARSTVQRYFERHGFSVHRDELGLTLSIEAPPVVLADTFGVPASRVIQASAEQTIRLPIPDEIAPLVEEIVVLPPPEFP